MLNDVITMGPQACKLGISSSILAGGSSENSSAHAATAAADRAKKFKSGNAANGHELQSVEVDRITRTHNTASVMRLTSLGLKLMLLLTPTPPKKKKIRTKMHRGK